MNKMTTIAIPENLKDELRQFGVMRETYSDIIKRLVESAKERQLQDILMSEVGTVTVESALKRAKARWQK